MTFSKLFLSLLLAAFFTFTSCQDDTTLNDTAASYIPASATSAASFHPQNMMDKAGYDGFEDLDFFKKMVSETAGNNPLLSQVLEQPELSGVDLDKPVFMAQKLMGEKEQQNTSMIFMSLKNAGDFEKLFSSEGAEIVEQGALRYITAGNAILGWNETTAIALLAHYPATDMAGELTQVFETGAQNSLAANRDFQKSQRGSHDISIWYSSNMLARPEGADAVLLALDIPPAAIRENSLHAYIDFENGRMSGHAYLSLHKSIGRELLGRMFKEKPKTDFTLLLPAEGLDFVTTVALDLRGIDKILSERPQASTFVEPFLDAIGLSRREVIATFGGDVLMAGYENPKGGDPVLVFATNFKNKKAADDYLAKAVGQGMLREMDGGGYKFLGVSSETFSIKVNKGLGFLALKDNVLCFSKDKNIVKTFQNGVARKQSLANLDRARLNGHSACGLLGKESLRDILPSGSQLFKSIEFSFGKNCADFILETGDAETNSLKTMMQKMDEAYRQKERDGRPEKII
jgi:uncharacterized protein DUF4836